MDYIYLFLILYFLITAAAHQKAPVSKFFNMKHGYLLIILFLGTTVIAQESAIKRASLSTAPSTSQKDGFMIQHSVGFMGVMSSVEHKNHSVTRGFLLPQGVALDYSDEDMEWILYPVPFSTHLNIDFSTAVSGDMEVVLFDVTGQLVFKETYTAQQKQEIYIGNLAQGEYLIQVTLMGRSFNAQILNYSKNKLNK